MLPQCDVIVSRDVLGAFDPIVEPATPLQPPQQHGAPDPGESEAVPERQERTRDDKKDRVEKRPQKKKNCEHDGADELHAAG